MGFPQAVETACDHLVAGMASKQKGHFNLTNREDASQARKLEELPKPSYHQLQLTLKGKKKPPYCKPLIKFEAEQKISCFPANLTLTANNF